MTMYYDQMDKLIADLNSAYLDSQRKSQDKFIHNGVFYYGLWKRHRRAMTQEDKDLILDEMEAKKKA